MNRTHDPQLRSWVTSANEPGVDFPIQNLPFGVFTRSGMVAARIGVAIGDRVLDLAACREEGLLDSLDSSLAESCAAPALNALMSLGRARWSQLRARISELLSAGNAPLPEQTLVPAMEARMVLPAAIGDYTDFYASIFHATNVGRLFRPANPLLPNYKYVPIAYHGRSSSIVITGTPIHRPKGQVQPIPDASPEFASSRRLDYELETGFFIGPGNRLGTPIPIGDAESHLFGLCLVNDWSARDIQAWEYQPLGPFLGKNFATSLSPWVVTMESLEPFRIPASRRPEGDPPPLPYLTSAEDSERGGIDLTLEVSLHSTLLSRANFRDMYWTPAQMVAHHSSNGCNLRPGDLLASGAISGEAPDSRGCLLELTSGGAKPVELADGEIRRFLEDGDEVILRGWCERPGYIRIGLGECRGTIVPAE